MKISGLLLLPSLALFLPATALATHYSIGVTSNASLTLNYDPLQGPDWATVTGPVTGGTVNAAGQNTFIVNNAINAIQGGTWNFSGTGSNFTAQFRNAVNGGTMNFTGTNSFFSAAQSDSIWGGSQFFTGTGSYLSASVASAVTNGTQYFQSGGAQFRAEATGSVSGGTAHLYSGTSYLVKVTNATTSGANIVFENGGTLDLFADTNIGQISSVNAGAGIITNDATVTGPVNLNVQFDTSTSTFSGVIQNAVSLSKAGTGIFVLSGLNTYTGGTTINGGTLKLDTSSNGTGVVRGALTINNGGILETSAINALGYNAGTKVDSLTINSGGTFNNSAAGTSGWGIAYTLNGATMLSNGGTNSATAASTFSFGGLAGANTSVTVGGNAGSAIYGHVDLRADNGNTNVNFTVNSGSSLNILAGISSNNGAAGLTKLGAGTMQLSFQNTYTGGTTVAGGTLALNGVNNSIGVIRGALTLTGGSTLDSQTSNAFGYADGVKVNTVSLSGGSILQHATAADDLGWGVAYTLDGSTMSSNGGTASTTSSSKFAFGGPGGSVAPNPNTSVTVNGTTESLIAGHVDLRSDNGNSNVDFTVNSGATLRVTAGISTNSAGGSVGTVGFTKKGAGAMILTATNTYNGGTTISGGLVEFSASGNFGAGTNNVLLNGGGLRWATGATTDISSRLAAIGSSGATFDTNGNNVTLASILSGTGAVTKQGAGNLILTAANTYTGGTTISAGLIQFSALNNFGTANITLNGGGLRWAGTVDISSKLNAIGSSGATFDTNGNNVTLSASPLTGTGAVTKQGAGTLTLSGNNTYSGGTTISTGTLAIGNASALGGAGTASISAGATLDSAAFGFNLAKVSGPGTLTGTGIYTYNSGSPASVSTTLAGTAAVLKQGAGTLTLSGNNTYTGGTTVSAGTLTLGSANALGSTGTANVASGATLDSAALGFNLAKIAGVGTLTGTGVYNYNSASSISVPTTLDGTAAVLKQGAGTLTLSGSNTYTGGTTLSAGTLALGSAGALGSSGTINFNGGTLQFSASNTNDYSARFSTAGSQPWSLDTSIQAVTLATALTGTGSSLAKLGGGTLVLAADNNNYTGGTTVSAGTLQLGNGGTTGGVAGNIALATGSTLAFNRSDAVTFSGNITAASGSGGILSLAGGTRDLTLDHANAALATIAGLGGTAITSGDNQSLRFGATAALTLASGATVSAANSVTVGGVAVSGGDNNNTSSGGNATVNLQAGSSLTLAGGVTIGGTAMTGGSGYRLTGGAGTVNLGTGASLSVANSLTLGGLLINGPAAGSELYGGSGVLNLGAGTFTLTGANPAIVINPIVTRWNGSTVPQTLRFGYDGTQATAAPTLNFPAGTTITNGGTIAFQQTDTLTLATPISGTGTVAQLGAGTTVLTGNNTWSGGTTISAGTLQIGNGGSLGTGNVTNYASLVFNRDDSPTYAGIISGTGSVTKAGTGTLTLTGNNTYSGGTTISAGVVQFSSGANLGSGAIILNSGGMLRWAAGNTTDISPRLGTPINGVAYLDTNGNDVSFGTPLTLGSIQKEGAGTLTLAAAYNGNVALYGGALEVPASGSITADGTGVVEVANGSLHLSGGSITSGSGYVGTGSSGATATLDSGSWTTTGILTVGYFSSLPATLAINGGSHSASTLRIGERSNGTLNFSGGTLTTNNIYVGYQLGSGAFSMSGGTLNSTSARIGFASQSASGSATISGGTWNTQSMDIDLGSLSLTSAGILNATTQFTLRSTLNLGTGGVAGTLSASRVFGFGASNPTVNFNHTGDYTFSPNLENSLRVNKLGAGTTILTGTNTYNGGTTVSAGKLIVNNTTGSGLGTGAVTVSSGATLGGSGSFTGALTLNGKISPGNSPGILTTGNETWNAGAGYTWEINDATGDSGIGYDFLSINGTLTVASTSGSPFTIYVTSINGTTPGSAANFNPAVDQHWIITTAAAGWSFDPSQFAIDTAGFTNTVGPRAWWSVSQVGNSLQLNFTAIPEPREWGMTLGLCLVALALLRRRSQLL